MTSEPATSPLDELLAEAHWLEGLARALVADREEARDLVQDVWLAAAAHAPARLARPRAWLARVLRNTLNLRRRASSARTARERSSARDEAVSSASDAVARAEAQQLLVASVLALDEPWRTTVIQRFFDGRSSEEIARRERVPASTVRNRLAQALELLRARLERSRGTDWMAGVALLARVGDGSALSASASGAGLLGGAIVSGTAKLVGVAAVALLLWWSWSARTEPAPLRSSVPLATAPPVGATVAETEPLAAPGERAPVISNDSPEAGSPETARTDPPADDLPPGVIEGQVFENDEPCEQSGRVELAANWYPSSFPDAMQTSLSQSLTTGACFRYQGLAPGQYGVRVELANGKSVSTSVQLLKERGVRLVLRLGSSALRGFVWNELGGAVPGATLTLSRKGGENYSATTDDEGRYEVDGLYEGSYWGTEHPPRTSDVDHPEKGGPDMSVHFQISIAPGEGQRLDIGIPERWPHVRGTLRTKTGAPHVGGAKLVLRSPSGNPSYMEREVVLDGSFDLCLSPGRYAVETVLHRRESVSVTLGEVAIDSGDIERDLVLPGARLSGRVLQISTGAPVAKRDLEVSVRLEGHDNPAAVRGATVSADGSFAIDALEPGTYLLNTHPLQVDGGKDSMRVVILPGQDELALDVFVRTP